MVPLDGPTAMVQFLEYKFTKALSPSLGVHQTWTKRNDHAPESECELHGHSDNFIFP